MTEPSIYKAILLDHYHNPRNKGDLDGMDYLQRGSNPRCGDEVEVGLQIRDEKLTRVRFRGRGCSICLASASMMTECTTGLTRTQARQMVAQVQQWFGAITADAAPDPVLAPLDAVRQHPARKKCVLLAWTALAEMLARD